MMHRLLAALLSITLLAGMPVASVAADQRAVLTIKVNTVAKQDATVLLHGDDVLVRASDLTDAGLLGFSFNHSGKPAEFVSLASLKPALTYRVDDVALALELTVNPSHLGGTVVDYGPHQDITLTKPVRSAFMNYSVSTATQTGVALSSEVGTRIGGGSFTSTISMAANHQYNSNITNWIYDSPRANERLTLGDVVTSTGDLGGTVAIAGIGIQRFFGLNPDTVKTALPQISGNALTPSTADVYVNGVLYRHEVLPPGQFNFQNLPITQGPNNTTIVVTDAFGRQQTFSNYFYGADTMLAKGLSDFSYGAGMLHSQFGEQVGHGAAAAARYSVGMTDNVTGGGRLELSQSTVSGGPAFSFRLSRGILSTELAASESGSAHGAAGLVSYQYIAGQMSGAFSLVAQTPHYASLALQPYQDRPTVNASVSLSRQLNSRSGITLAYYQQQDRDNGAQHTWQISQTTQLSDSLQLQVSENLVNGATGRQIGLQTALNFIPRHGLAASLNVADTNGHAQASLQVQKPVDSQIPSFGYTLSAAGGQGSVSEYASADYRGQFGDYLATVSSGAGGNSMSLNVAGGLVFIGGRLFLTRSVTDSYALVDTNGLSNVRILANNIVVGRTNKRGYLLVPQLGSYLSNEISIDSADTPMNYNIDEQNQHVAPLYRSGSVVQFGINQVRPVTGALVIRHGASTVVPAFGLFEVTTANAVLKSDIGEGGEFYFDKLPTGTYKGVVQFSGGECHLELTIPQTKDRFIKLGTVVCENGVGS